jgi:uncharacterized Tic20 family protein
MNEIPQSELPSLPEGQPLAVTAEGLYLANLLMLPGIAFIAILWLYFRNKESAPKLALCHLRQTVSATLWAIAIILVLNGVIIASGGYGTSRMWMIIMIYFEVIHVPLILIGVVGALKALQGKPFKYPLIGVKCE